MTVRTREADRAVSGFLSGPDASRFCKGWLKGRLREFMRCPQSFYLSLEARAPLQPAGWASCSRGRRGNSIPSPARREASSSGAPGRRAGWCYYPPLTSEETRRRGLRGLPGNHSVTGGKDGEAAGVTCSPPWTVRMVFRSAGGGGMLSSLSAHFCVFPSSPHPRAN